MPSSKQSPASSPSPPGTYSAAGLPVASRMELAERYLPLVKSIVARMRMHLPPSLDVEDVCSIGIYGLMSALQNYDPNKGTAFGAYASMRIRGAILDELRKLDWMPRKLRAQARRVGALKNELEQELGRVPEDAEVAEALGLSLNEYLALDDDLRPISIVNLDALFEEGDSSGSSSLHEVIDDRTEVNAREYMEDRETIGLLRQAITELPEMPRKVLAMYYFEEMRLAEIAAVFNLSESRICQIHSKAVIQLRQAIRRMQR